jgi:hypothetical protein
MWLIRITNTPLNEALYTNGERMKYLALLFIVLISGCSSQPLSQQLSEFVIEEAFEKATNTKVSYDGSTCPNVKRACSKGDYHEWYQANGQKACACNK